MKINNQFSRLFTDITLGITSDFYTSHIATSGRVYTAELRRSNSTVSNYLDILGYTGTLYPTVARVQNTNGAAYFDLYTGRLKGLLDCNQYGLTNRKYLQGNNIIASSTTEVSTTYNTYTTLKSILIDSYCELYITRYVKSLVAGKYIETCIKRNNEDVVNEILGYNDAYAAQIYVLDGCVPGDYIHIQGKIVDVGTVCYVKEVYFQVHYKPYAYFTLE